ncbi:MAG TPA: SIMPL domain-containing protein [Rhizomicrobium sp.]|jgi:uncharacterized protein YggE
MKFHLSGFAVLIAACVVSLPALAQSAPQSLPHLLVVSGTGEVKAKPDQAMLSAGVVSEARSAAEALSANSRDMTNVFATLKRLGIPDKSIRTSNFQVTPQYPPYDSKQPHRITGYQVSNTVSVTVDDLDKVGPALDALVASGANNLGDIAFSIRDDKTLMAGAREAAVKDATAKAETLARAAGVSLGPIVEISEGGGYQAPQPMYRMAMSAPAAPPPPVAAGEETVSVSVSMSWEIR